MARPGPVHVGDGTVCDAGWQGQLLYMLVMVLFVIQDGKANSATVVGAFLVFLRLMDNASSAMHLFSARRGPPGITPSQKR